MGPRTSIRGNPGSRRRRLAMGVRSAASMGPRTSIRGNHVHGARFPASDDEALQWGRGLPSAETPRIVHPRNTSATAAVWGFNGAADFHPRKRQWTTRKDPDSKRASMGPRTSIRGNFFIPDAIRPTAYSIARASMGPRTSIRGNRNSPAGNSPRPAWRCFNGAADFHPRKRDAVSASGVRHARKPGFNGAADFHPRKHHVGCVVCLRTT